MRWLVKYNAGHSEVWDLNFPPQCQWEDGDFDEFISMADVLIEGLDSWIVFLNFALAQGIIGSPAHE